MRIAVDVDGVLADRVGAVLSTVRDRHGVAVEPADVDRWEYVVPGPDEAITSVISRVTADDPDHLLDCSPVPGATEAMRRLARDHHVVVATHRDRSLHGLTREWFEAHDIPYHEFLDDCGPDKAHVDADVLVDDKPANVRTFARERGWAVLFSQPWNAGVTVGDAVSVADDWSDVLGTLDRRTG
jgi:5'(3')-deoxyribonucleotidase